MLYNLRKKVKVAMLLRGLEARGGGVLISLLWAIEPVGGYTIETVKNDQREARPTITFLAHSSFIGLRVGGRVSLSD